MNLLLREIKNLSEPIIHTDTLKKIVKKYYPNYNDNSIRWVFFDLTKKKIITRISNNKYFIGWLREYEYKLFNDVSLDLLEKLKIDFPEINIAIFETVMLNEWVNHLIARNVIIVEVEKPFIRYIFRYIQKFYPRVLLNPSEDELSLYDDAMIIVKPLVTQAPINKEQRTIKIEKLIVDLFTNDIINQFISGAEKEEVISEIRRNYVVNEKTVLAYAKRRSNFDVLAYYLSENKISQE